MPMPSAQSLQGEIDAFSWFHGINFGEVQSKGRATPQNWSLYGLLSFMEEIDFFGTRVLDVGTMDGLAAFIAEREGAAEVIATDLYERDSFYFARRLLNSRVAYEPRTSIEHLIERHGRGAFDVVIMGGLLYHLMSPLRAILIGRALIKTGGVLLCETVACNRRDPVMVFNPSQPVVDEYTTYFVPSPSAATGMMRYAFFNVLMTARSEPGGLVKRWKGADYARFSIMGQAVDRDGATPENDLMRRVQERAIRSKSDLITDNLSLAVSLENRSSTLRLKRIPDPAHVEHREIDPKTFKTRFDLQP